MQHWVITERLRRSGGQRERGGAESAGQMGGEARGTLTGLYGALQDDPELLREQQQLDVEDPRREVLVREHDPCRRAREQLEAALRVAHVPDADDAQDRVQAVHEHVPEQRALGVAG